MNLAELFPDDDYRFTMRFWRSEPPAFFQPTAANAVLLSERRRWLSEDPARHTTLLPEGVALLEETIELAQQWNASVVITPGTGPLEQLKQLGCAWEPDFLLLCPDAQGRFVLRCGCVCFPSSWSLAEKIGHPLEAIHDVVPGLNDALSRQIHGFLSKLKPGTAWQRANWGLSRSPELNQHPERKLRRLDATATANEVFVRVEEQVLVALPKANGVLFGIRILSVPLVEFRNDAALAKGLKRALQTMPEDMARYKGIATSREQIIGFLG